MAKNKSTTNEKDEAIFTRPPIVTVMGHVDHGKTSILDAIRHTSVQVGEYGGITQHIGAYQIEYKSKKITFIDTPGHAAFTQMRARGGKVADIVILVVAADEGVKPQTKEAIAHARAGGGVIIVALNKIDLPGADAQKAKQELAQENILVEDWGGDIVCVEVSAKTGVGLDKLLDSVLAISEMLELKANFEGELEGVIIESKLDRKKGATVVCVVKNGTLTIGREISGGRYTAKVRSLMNDKGQVVKEAFPSDPVEILGFKEVPNVGDLIVAKGSELIELAVDESREEIVGKDAKKTITIVVRADTQGTLEAVKAGLASLVSQSVGASFALKFLLCTTGDVTESDVLLASNSKGIIVGFDVRVAPNVEDLARSLKVPVKVYKTIYELVDDVKELLEGTALDAESKIKGRAKVIKLFKLESGDVVVGCKVLAGVIKNTSRLAIYSKDPAELTKDDDPLYRGGVKKLKQGRDDVKLVGKDNDCGVLLKPQFNDISEGMWLEIL